MTSNVVNKIIGQCRNALLGGIPILYIRTDSEVLIRRIVYNWENLLVVPINNSTCGTYALRPVAEMIRDGVNYDEKKIANIKRGTPQAMPQQQFPTLWYYGFSDKAEPDKLALLEAYVLAHEDPKFPSYEKLQSSAAIIFSSTVHLTPMLRPYVEVIEVPYPDEEEIRDLIISESGAAAVLKGEYLNRLVTLFHGFTTEEIETTMQRIMALVPLEDSEKVEAQIRSRKKQRMEGGVLEFVSDQGGIGGMEQFRRWLEKQKPALDRHVAYKQKVGTLPPKGVLLCGIPGCGKSEAAKFTAKELKLPLLKLDIGTLMDKFVGSSEQRMRDALQMAESMAPCVLWIDELEKGFSGASGSDSDGGAFKRMFGYMLGWMQDVKVPVFIFATANNIGGLPKEFFRSGRFDALYAVYLPTAEECASIFISSMNRAVRNAAAAKRIHEAQVTLFSQECFDNVRLKQVVNTALVHKNGNPRIVIGSDIQKIVNIALRKLVDQDCIRGDVWFRTLQETLQDPTVSVYGDGEENVDSIAVGYCRLLRKNFLPTADTVLFRPEDYVPANLEAYERALRIPTEGMNPEEEKAHKARLRNLEILRFRDQKLENAYDMAVYRCLYSRINQFAVQLERHERTMMIR